MASETAAPTGQYQGLLVDWGGVLTTDLFASFATFCAAAGLKPDVLAQGFRHDPNARQALIDLEEGKLAEADFEVTLGGLIGVSPVGLIDKLFAGAGPEEPMIAAVRAAHTGGIRTGLISNSWGTSRYDQALLAELFDGVVISGDVGMRKPAPEMYTLGAKRIGLPANRCVFVDDLPFNLTPAAELGMGTVHHRDSATTIQELEELLGVALS